MHPSFFLLTLFIESFLVHVALPCLAFIHLPMSLRNGKDATTKVELQLIELRRRIESQKAKAARDIMLKSNESLTVAGGSGSLEYDQSNHSIMSRNSFGDGNISRNSFGDGNISRRNSLDGKDGEIRKSSLRLPPLEHRVLSPAKSVSSSSRMQQPVDRMYDVVMLDHMMPVMVTHYPLS